MLTIQTGYSEKKDTEQAFREAIRTLPAQPGLMLFFASTIYDFEQLTNLFHDTYPNTEVVGVTTAGEISKAGFSDNSLSVIAWESAQFRAKGAVITEADQYPVLSRDALIETAKAVGLNPESRGCAEQGFAFLFPNGLIMAEEKVLSIVHSIFAEEGFQIFGGTAGDDCHFTQTMTSLNGRVYTNAAIVVFVKTSHRFYIHKENIFRSTGKSMRVTKVDLEQRIVKEINGRRASSEYARELGVPEDKLSDYFMSNPLGRKINDTIWIASPFQVLPDGSIQFYCQIFADSIVYILEPEDAIQMLRQSMEAVRRELGSVSGAVAINCILRKLQFQNQHIIGEIGEQLGGFPQLAGFSSYGEQMGNMQLNQTMLVLAFEN